MNYTLEHLKIVHNAGAKKLSFDKTLELISLLERNGLFHLVSDPSTRKKTKTRYTRKLKVPGHRSTLSLTITGFLSTRGATGVHVKDIAKAVKAPLSSVRVWFYTTGKKYLKTGEIRKVAPATFGYFKPEKVAK
jgi:hypothetical protein